MKLIVKSMYIFIKVSKRFTLTLHIFVSPYVCFILENYSLKKYIEYHPASYSLLYQAIVVSRNSCFTLLLCRSISHQIIVNIFSKVVIYCSTSITSKNYGCYSQRIILILMFIVNSLMIIFNIEPSDLNMNFNYLIDFCCYYHLY